METQNSKPFEMRSATFPRRRTAEDGFTNSSLLTRRKSRDVLRAFRMMAEVGPHGVQSISSSATGKRKSAFATSMVECHGIKFHRQSLDIARILPKAGFCILSKTERSPFTKQLCYSPSRGLIVSREMRPDRRSHP